MNLFVHMTTTENAITEPKIELAPNQTVKYIISLFKMCERLMSKYIFHPTPKCFFLLFCLKSFSRLFLSIFEYLFIVLNVSTVKNSILQKSSFSPKICWKFIYFMFVTFSFNWMKMTAYYNVNVSHCDTIERFKTKPSAC